MVRECDRAAELIDVAIYSDSGQCCFWHGALIIGAWSVVHPTYFKVLLANQLCSIGRTRIVRRRS
ncbi:MAG: hypothetical protein MJA27_05785 [Pseudanabaenales cyanobacterium]|nr:hypothetical protein [Pseudanabaenales cyanobacterium]